MPFDHVFAKLVLISFTYTHTHTHTYLYMSNNFSVVDKTQWITIQLIVLFHTYSHNRLSALMLYFDPLWIAKSLPCVVYIIGEK